MRRILSKQVHFGFVLLALVPLILLPFPARAVAVMMTVNEGLDHALDPGHDPKLVIVGRVKEFKFPPLPRPGSGGVDFDPSFDIVFHVDTVLFGDLKDENLALHVPSFEWPSALVPQKADAYCVLLLSKDSKGKLTLVTVVPAKPGRFVPAKDYTELRAMLADQILAQLSDEKEIASQWHLLIQLGPILDKDRAKQIEPFLESKSIWVHRAALGAIMWATLDPQRIEEVNQDLNDFLIKTKPTDQVNDLEPNSTSEPFWLLTRAYFFLDSEWRNSENQRNDSLRPLLRRIADDANLSVYRRWQNGYVPLCRIGTTDDAKILWDCYNTPDESFRNEILTSRPLNRQLLLMALSRIYDLKLSHWSQAEFIPAEAQQAQTVHQALIDRKVINE